MAGLPLVFSIVCDGQGARSEMETLDSRPSAERTLAKLGLASSNSTSSTRGSLLLLTNRRTRTSPGWISQDGRDFPTILLLENPRNRSWGVAFVAVQSSDRTACRASGRTAYHDEICCLCVRNKRKIVLQTV